MYFWGNDFEELCKKNCRQYRVYADVYPKNDSGGYDAEPQITYTADGGSFNAGNLIFEDASIVSVKITRGMTSGSFSYGGAFGGQLTLVTTANTDIPPSDTKITVSVSFVSDDGTETRRAALGTFYSESVSDSQFTKTIKANDGISKLGKYYVPDAAEFPMTAKELFAKASDVAGAAPSFGFSPLKLNNPNITEAPIKNAEVEEPEASGTDEVYIFTSESGKKYHKSPTCSGMSGASTLTQAEAEEQGYTPCTKSACFGAESSKDKYYTYREIAGMIASVNAGNAFITATNELSISTPDINLKRDIPIKSVISYTDKGVINNFSSTFWAQAYEGEETPPIIDPLSEEYDPSVMVVDFPLKTDGDYTVMQGNIDNQISGISYNGIVIKKQGTGRQEIGDLLAFSDTYRGRSFDNVLVMGISYEISASKGFIETLYSLAKTEAQQQAKGISVTDRVTSAGGVSGSSSGKGSGVGEFTNKEKTSEIFNSYKDVKDENGKVTSVKNFINEKTPFAHAGGSNNSIDKANQDETLTKFSEMSSILGGARNSIVSSQHSAIVNGYDNKILSGGNLSAIVGGNENSVAADASAIVAGVYNSLESGFYASAILAGNSNTIYGNDNRQSVIAGGEGNKIGVKNGSPIHAYNSFIGGGDSNAVSASHSTILAGQMGTINEKSTFSAILAGRQGSIISAPYSGVLAGQVNEISGGGSNSILAGSGNKILNSGFCSVLAGYSNTIDSDSKNCSVIAGQNNSIIGCSNCSILGAYNTVKKLRNSTVVGNNNTVEKDDNAASIIIGTSLNINTSGSLNGAALIIGANSANFYVDLGGNVYARSFNIIGDSAAAVSAAEETAPTSDISELSERISQMQAEIEALKAEIAQLKGETN